MLEALLDEPEGVTVIVTSTQPESVVMVLCAGAEVEGVDACGALVAEVEVVEDRTGNENDAECYPKNVGVDATSVAEHVHGEVGGDELEVIAV